jgi:hypothetical protein
VDEPPELDDALVVVEAEEDPLPVAGAVATVLGLVTDDAVLAVPDWNIEAAPPPQPHRRTRENIARKGRESRELV